MSKHVTIEELLKQIAENTASIRQESTVRAGADEAIASHIGAMSTNLPSSIESHNYVPGVSGWKLDQKSGDFEINTCTLGAVGSSPERQTVSVEVCSYSKYDLPKNAANLVQFMEAELHKVPEEYRHAAEFEEFDTSYGDDTFNPRLFLSYSRLETEEELAYRLERAKQAGVKVDLSKGVLTISQDGVPRVRIGELNMDVLPRPFVVDQGQVFVSQASLTGASIRKAEVAADPGNALESGAGPASLDKWSVRMEMRDGKYVAAGIGLGLGSQFLVSADRYAINDREEGGILDALSARLTATTLGRDLAEQIKKINPIADTVREILRAELKPGGLLHRYR